MAKPRFAYFFGAAHSRSELSRLPKICRLGLTRHDPQMQMTHDAQQMEVEEMLSRQWALFPIFPTGNLPSYIHIMHLLGFVAESPPLAFRALVRCLCRLPFSNVMRFVGFLFQKHAQHGRGTKFLGVGGWFGLPSGRMDWILGRGPPSRNKEHHLLTKRGTTP